MKLTGNLAKKNSFQVDIMCTNG